MRALLTSISFLTVAPVAPRTPLREGDLGRAAVCFPLVGLLLGLALAAVDHGARMLWDPYVASALVIGAALLVTGGLHLDGFLDTADALASRRDREGMLAVMRDARVGALGAAAGTALLLAKLAAYGHLTGHDHWRTIAAVPVLGRLGIVLAAAVFPTARPGGLGARFASEAGLWHLLAAALLAAAIAFGLLQWTGLMLATAAIAGSALLGWWLSRRFGGLTGDAYGAINEAIELAVLLMAGASLNR